MMISHFDDTPVHRTDWPVITDYIKGILEHRKGYGASYMAGTLMFENPADSGHTLCINIRPLNEIDEGLHEMCYYASQLYVDRKSPTAHFTNCAKQNIREYETFKRFDEFFEAGLNDK